MKTEEARAVLAELEKKAAATRAEIAEINEHRAGSSFAAHASADVEATQTLKKLNIDRIAALARLEELERAIAQARQLIAIAQTGEDEEAQRKRAEQARPIAERLAARGKRMDEAMAVVLAERAGIDADAEALARLGVPVANADLRRVNLRRWIDAATMSFDKHARPVPPGERTTAEALTTTWMRSSLQFIADKLNNAAARVAA